MATRTHAREAVVELLYAYSSGNLDIRKFAPALLSQKKIKNMQAEFALNLFDEIINNIEQIDCIIKESLQSWDFKRLGMVDKCILRLGVYETIHTNLDIPIIINEAIEISKILGSDNTPRFVNGILDSIGKLKREAKDKQKKNKAIDCKTYKINSNINLVESKNNDLKNASSLDIKIDSNTKIESKGENK